VELLAKEILAAMATQTMQHIVLVAVVVVETLMVAMQLPMAARVVMDKFGLLVGQHITLVAAVGVLTMQAGGLPVLEG
jgi:hypothetical protein